MQLASEETPTALLGTTFSTTPQAAGWQPGSIFSTLFSNGTAAHPDAGLLIGNGYSFDGSSCEALPGAAPCWPTVTAGTAAGWDGSPSS